MEWFDIHLSRAHWPETSATFFFHLRKQDIASCSSEKKTVFSHFNQNELFKHPVGYLRLTVGQQYFQYFVFFKVVFNQESFFML